MGAYAYCRKCGSGNDAPTEKQNLQPKTYGVIYDICRSLGFRK